MEQKFFNLLPEEITLEGAFMKKEVRINGKKLSIKRSRKYINKSSDFNWGYGGSGPSQFAFALLLQYWPVELAQKYFQLLKFKFIGGLPSTDFIKTVRFRELMQEIIEFSEQNKLK